MTRSFVLNRVIQTNLKRLHEQSWYLTAVLFLFWYTARLTVVLDGSLLGGTIPEGGWSYLVVKVLLFAFVASMAASTVIWALLYIKSRREDAGSEK